MLELDDMEEEKESFCGREESFEGDDDGGGGGGGDGTTWQ